MTAFGRQALDRAGMRAGYRQFDMLVISETAPVHAWIDAEILAAQATLDRDLPCLRR